MNKEPYKLRDDRANKDDPDMCLVNLSMPRQDADALIRIANAQGIGRSELLRRVARGMIENETQNGARE